MYYSGESVISKLENLFYDINFSEFSNSLVEVTKNTVETFWEQDTNVNIKAINNFREFRDEKLISGANFFTSQIKVENHRPIMIRLSDNFIDNFLMLTLENSISDFKLSNLTPLEMKILNSFCEFYYKKLYEILIPIKDLKISEKSNKYINIFFNLKPKKSNATSNIVVSVPEDRFRIKKLEKDTSFSDVDFINSCTTVRVKMGSSKISLRDLKGLQCDDILILDDSEVRKATLLSGNFEKQFNIKVNSSLILNIDDEEEENIEQSNDEVIMEKNLWDDIQVEINAEFEKVKMSVGELKQITQGQIIDLGSIFNSEISLFVENKKVAIGELIIINDRYAVKLDKVLSTKESQEAKQIKLQQQPNIQQDKILHQQMQQIQKAPSAHRPIEKKPIHEKHTQDMNETKGQQEDFDYSDFEN